MQNILYSANQQFSNRSFNIVHPEMELATEASNAVASAMQAVYVPQKN